MPEIEPFQNNSFCSIYHPDSKPTHPYEIINYTKTKKGNILSPENKVKFFFTFFLNHQKVESAIKNEMTHKFDKKLPEQKKKKNGMKMF